jgi:hypothetical protein
MQNIIKEAKIVELNLVLSKIENLDEVVIKPFKKKNISFRSKNISKKNSRGS